MSKLTIQNIKFWIFSFSAISLLFFTFVFFQNGTTLIITMESSTKSPLQPQIFFAKEGQPYIEKNSRRPYKVEQDNYYFKLPQPDKMQYVRFDPAKTESKISVKKMTLHKTKWFKTSLYDVLPTNIIPVHQIAQFKTSNDQVNFSTTGSDPHFNMRLSSTYISTINHKHLNLLIIAILIFTVLIFLSRMYIAKKSEYTSSSTLDIEEFSICQN